MFVTEKLPYFIDIIFFSNSVKNIEQIWVFEISKGYASIIIYIQCEKYAHNNGISVPVLKFWSCL